LAKTESAQLFDQFDVEETIQDQARLAEPSAALDDRTWFAILGLSESAKIDEIRNAYKTSIKQNHPDRVHDMSPALRRLAESETKMINAAYRQALHLFAIRV
jgi:DnaJ-domain-containing protein 1